MVILLLFIFVLCPGRVFIHFPSLSLVHSVLRGIPEGRLNGVFQGHPNHANYSPLKPGDILVCHNAHGGYGYWTHAVLYVGNGRTVDANNFVRGTELKSVKDYENYDSVEFLRVRVSARIRNHVMKNALANVGKPYDPFGGVRDTHSEYCSKLIWQLYAQEGVLLVVPSVWVLPDDLVHSKLVQQVSLQGDVQSAT